MKECLIISKLQIMIKELKSRTHFQSIKLTKSNSKFGELIEELRTRKLSQNTIDQINEELDLINIDSDEKTLKKLVFKKQYKVLQIVEKEHKLVPKNHYRNKWMVLGTTIFGLPFGVIFGSALSNMAFLGIGLPIGMPIGMAIGAKKDMDAAKQGLQLNFSLG